MLEQSPKSLTRCKSPSDGESGLPRVVEVPVAVLATLGARFRLSCRGAILPPVLGVLVAFALLIPSSAKFALELPRIPSFYDCRFHPTHLTGPHRGHSVFRGGVGHADKPNA